MSVETVMVGRSNEMIDELTPEEQALFDGETPAEAPVEEAPAEAPVTEETPVAETQPGETQADEEGEEVLEQNGGRFVRHAALHQERSRRKELQKQLTEFQQQTVQYRENQARLDERLRLLNEALSGGVDPTTGQPVAIPGQQPQPKKVVAPEEDPFVFMRQLAERIDQLGEATQASHQRFQEQDTYSQVQTAFKQDAQAFTGKQADFPDAYRHLLSSRDRELEKIGYRDPAERSKVIANEELMIVAQALQAGKSPAELVYALSQDRGYRKAEPAAPAVAPAPAAQAAPSAVQKVQQVKQATGANKSLGSAGGANTPVITAESLASMSEAEFERVYASLSKADRRAFFGG